MSQNHDDISRRADKAYGSGNFDLARSLYLQLVELPPAASIANYKLSLLELADGNERVAVSYARLAAESNPPVPEYWVNYIRLSVDAGRTVEAKEAIDKAQLAGFVGNDFFAEALLQIGIQEYNDKNFEGALISANQALIFRPGFSKAYNNMAVAQLQKKEFEPAIENLKQAIHFEPSFAEAYNNLGGALEKLGQIEDAVTNYKKAIQHDLDYVAPQLNLRNLEIQLVDYDWEKTPAIENLKSKSSLGLPKLEIFQAIEAYIFQDSQMAQVGLDNYRELFEQGKTKALTGIDQLFCQAYYGFIQHLLGLNTLDQSESRVIYHLGDSHCLSYAHSYLLIDNEKMRIEPRLTIGAKAFHLAHSENNGFKAITKINLNLLPRRSLVFLSFGEIDCRIDEGIIPAAAKSGKSIELIASEVASGLVSWVFNQSLLNNHQHFFFNVPAPVYDKSFSKFENHQRSEVVKIFNNKLAKEVSSVGMHLIDVYKRTADQVGFSNGLFHCDAHHLDSQILPFVQTQFG